MIRRRFLEAVGAVAGVSLLGGGDEPGGDQATDAEVRQAVEEAEADGGAGGAPVQPSPNAWSLAALEVGELQGELDQVRISGSAETITGGQWDTFVDVDVETGFGILHLSLDGAEARDLAERLQEAADQADAEAAEAEQAESWDDLR